MSLFPSIFVPLPFFLCTESTSYVFPFRMVFFYIVTTGWIFDISLLCVCVCVFSSHSFWTSSSLDVPAGVTQEEGHTGFFIHLLSAVGVLTFLVGRIQPFLSLVDREVEFCVLTI